MVSPNFKHAKGEQQPPSADEALSLAVASSSLFGTAKTKVPVSGFPPSAKLVALSKKIKDDAKAAEAAEVLKRRIGRAGERDPDILSSDGDVPIAQLFPSKFAMGKPDPFPAKPPPRVLKGDLAHPLEANVYCPDLRRNPRNFNTHLTNSDSYHSAPK